VSQRLNSHDLGSVYLDRGGPAQQFHRNNQSDHPLLSNQDPFEAGQRTVSHPDPVPARQERIRFESVATIDNPPHGIDLLGRYTRRSAIHPTHDANEPGGSENLQLAIHAATNEDVAWEQWHQEALGAILPAVLDPVNRKKNLMTFRCKHMRHDFFMPMSGIQCVPLGPGFEPETFQLILG
jgi:hypothetical protein